MWCKWMAGTQTCTTNTYPSSLSKLIFVSTSAQQLNIIRTGWYLCPCFSNSIKVDWIWSRQQPGLTAWSWRRQSRGWNRSRYSICILWVHVLVINHHMCLCHHHKYQDEQDQWGHLCKGASLFMSLWSLTRLSLHISLISPHFYQCGITIIFTIIISSLPPPPPKHLHQNNHWYLHLTDRSRSRLKLSSSTAKTFKRRRSNILSMYVYDES